MKLPEGLFAHNPSSYLERDGENISTYQILSQSVSSFVSYSVYQAASWCYKFGILFARDGIIKSVQKGMLIIFFIMIEGSVAII